MSYYKVSHFACLRSVFSIWRAHKALNQQYSCWIPCPLYAQHRSHHSSHFIPWIMSKCILRDNRHGNSRLQTVVAGGWNSSTAEIKIKSVLLPEQQWQCETRLRFVYSMLMERLRVPERYVRCSLWCWHSSELYESIRNIIWVVLWCYPLKERFIVPATDVYSAVRHATWCFKAFTWIRQS